MSATCHICPALLLLMLAFGWTACGTSVDQSGLSAPGTTSQETNPERKQEGKADAEYRYIKISGDTIFFTNGQHYKTHLFETEFIGLIDVVGKAPYLIYSGRDCNECDANISLYVHSPDDGVLDVSNGQNRYVYPGKVMHYETGELIYESSCYYGEVLNGIKGVIWYITDHGEADSIYHHTFLLNGKGTELQDTLWKSIKTLSETEALFKAGKCKEIAGETFTSEP